MKKDRINQEQINKQCSYHFKEYSFLQFQAHVSKFGSKEKKTVKNNLSKLMVWGLPSTEQEKTVTVPRPEGSLLTGIN